MRWPWQKPKWGAEQGTELDRLMDQPTVINTSPPDPVDKLPYWPGDCPRCGGRCDCEWQIETVFEGNDDVTYATWNLGSVACPVCRKRAEDWPRTEIGRTPRTDL